MTIWPEVAFRPEMVFLPEMAFSARNSFLAEITIHQKMLFAKSNFDKFEVAV